MTKFLRIILLALFLPVFSVLAMGDPVGSLGEGESAIVTYVIDGDTVRLESGLEVRMTGIQAPKLPLGRSGFPTWPMAPESRDALVKMADRRTVVLAYGGAKRDRHGRALAQIFRGDGLWLQGEMVVQGLARVYSFPDNRACVRALLQMESEARAARRGLWALPYYRVRSVEETPEAIDNYHLIEGTVLSVSRKKDRTYLNFGTNWREDFTATVSPKDMRLFDAEGIDLLALEGARVRLRGWLTSYNGPNLEITHPEQIERLDRQEGLLSATMPTAILATEMPCELAIVVPQP